MSYYHRSAADLRKLARDSPGKLRKLRQIIRDREPRRFAGDMDMQLRSDPRIAIQRPKRQAEDRVIAVEFGQNG
jgi:hypothetical protein